MDLSGQLPTHETIFAHLRPPRIYLSQDAEMQTDPVPLFPRPRCLTFAAPCVDTEACFAGFREWKGTLTQATQHVAEPVGDEAEAEQGGEEEETDAEAAVVDAMDEDATGEEEENEAEAEEGDDEGGCAWVPPVPCYSRSMVSESFESTKTKTEPRVQPQQVCPLVRQLRLEALALPPRVTAVPDDADIDWGIPVHDHGGWFFSFPGAPRSFRVVGRGAHFLRDREGMTPFLRRSLEVVVAVARAQPDRVLVMPDTRTEEGVCLLRAMLHNAESRHDVVPSPFGTPLEDAERLRSAVDPRLAERAVRCGELRFMPPAQAPPSSDANVRLCLDDLFNEAAQDGQTHTRCADRS